MQLEKLKKEKRQRQNRQALKTLYLLVDIDRIPQLLRNTCSTIEQLSMLRLTACIEINYLVYSYVQIGKRICQEIKEQENSKQSIIIQQKLPQRQTFKGFQNLKVGIIGGGVTGTLVMNSLLILIKQGLNPQNVVISTRESQKFKLAQEIYGFKSVFNNEKVAEQSDILIIAVHSTLDNWIITDLKQSIMKRINNKLKMFKPLIYILTSNIYHEKIKRLFNIDVMVPTIRASDRDIINNYLQLMKTIIKNEGQENERLLERKLQTVEKAFSKKIVQEERIAYLKKYMEDLFDGHFKIPPKISIKSQENEEQQGKSRNKSPKKKHDKHSQEKSKTLDYLLEKQINRLQSLTKNTVENVLSMQGSYQETFQIKCRKWRMAYNNYVA